MTSRLRLVLVVPNQMASHGVRPTIDLAAARGVLAEHVPRVLKSLSADSIEQLGWQKIGERTLYVPMTGTVGNATESYLLRLLFLTGNDWPPSAQFVNPETLEYKITDDLQHLPILESPEVHVHPKYDSPHGGQIQLICCSATYEYYDLLHGGEARHLWTVKDDFYLTISAIQRAMGNHYKGRHTKHHG